MRLLPVKIVDFFYKGVTNAVLSHGDPEGYNSQQEKKPFITKYSRNQRSIEIKRIRCDMQSFWFISHLRYKLIQSTILCRALGLQESYRIKTEYKQFSSHSYDATSPQFLLWIWAFISQFYTKHTYIAGHEPNQCLRPRLIAFLWMLTHIFFLWLLYYCIWVTATQAGPETYSRISISPFHSSSTVISVLPGLL